VEQRIRHKTGKMQRTGLLGEGIVPKRALGTAGVDFVCIDGIHVDMDHLKKGEVK